MVLEPAHLPAPQVVEALKAYTTCQEAGKSAQLEQREDAVGRVLVAALGGDATAQKVLFSMGADLDLDGHAAEVYNDAIALYDAFAAQTARVPKRPGA
jgi:hypothetical protein